MRYAIYDPATGAILRHGACSPNALELQAREGEAAIVIPDEVDNPENFKVVGEAFEALPPVVSTFRVTYTFNQWVDRFPLSAQAAIVQATMTDPLAKLIYDRAFSAGMSGSIDPADARTIEGVQYLASRGYITADEASGALAL